jgi:DNA-binding response OmpR family regulator
MEREPVRILVVDDEEDLVWALRRSLADEGYQVLTAYDGVEALELARRERPDLVILDIVMPGLDGLEVCRRLRRDPTVAAVPILFLTVRSLLEDRVTGLDEGCDAYLVKPFDMRELKAHVRALLRRTRLAADRHMEPDDRDSVLEVASLALDLRTHQVSVGGKAVQLTPTESGLLRYLMLHAGEVLSSKILLEAVWGYPPEAATPGLVRWHIRNLRAKIESDPAHPVYIRTVPRHGYIFPRDP